MCLCDSKAVGWKTQPSAETIAATQPLLKEIETLKDQLELLEAKHDTLEAATEQFRLKAKSFKDKLSEEKSRCDELAQENDSLENRLHQEIESWTKRYEEAMIQVSSLESNVAVLLSDQGTKETDFESERAIMDARINELEREIQKVSEENAKLTSSLHDQDANLSQTIRDNTILRQEIKELLGKMSVLEQRSKLPRWQVQWRDIAESEIGSTFIELVHDYWEWFHDDVVPVWMERIATLVAAIRHEGASLYAKTAVPPEVLYEQFQQSAVGALALAKDAIAQCGNTDFKAIFDTILQGMKTMVGYFGSLLSFVSGAVSTSDPLTLIKAWFTKLAVFHKTAVVLLEWIATSISSFYIASMDGSQEEWPYTICLFVKEHSNMILLGLEVLLGVLMVDMAFSLASRIRRRWTEPPRTTYPRKIPLVHSGGSNHSRSLLRTAGVPTLRSQ